MPKIALIGAGSSGFTRTLLTDILSFEALRATEFAFMDIDEERLDVNKQLADKLLEQENLPATVSATTDRREALDGADYVICTILAHGMAPFENEIEIPYKYGITQPVGDTLCVGGIFRALRTIPVIVDICRDIEEMCPEAWMLNYTNPVAMVTWACNVATNTKFIGLCHGVPWTAMGMAKFIGMEPKEVRYWTAGINHLAWFLRFEDAAGEDLYPLFWETLAQKGPPEDDKYRFEFAQHIGYFMTESSRHFSEYVPYYRTSEEVLAGGKDFEHFAGRRIEASEKNGRREAYVKEALQMIRGEKPIPFGERSPEYTSNIIYSLETNELFRFNGNVMNYGLISNLPEGCCVEVPCLVDSLGIHPCAVGELPPQCAALDRMNINAQTLAVQAALEGDRDKAFQAVLVDPLTAAVLRPKEIRAMFDELFEANRQWMPQF